MFDAVVIVLLILVALLVPIGILYFHYSNTPARQWKRRVLSAIREQEHRRRQARHILEAPPNREQRALRSEYLERHLRSVSVDELVRYPGVGPVTVSRLKDAGLSNLDALGKGRLTVPGIGPARQKDIRKAMAEARRDAESQFNAGACPEAIAYEAERKKRDADRVRHQAKAESTIRDADGVLAYLEEPCRIASKVTFLGFLRRRPLPEFTEDLLDRPLAPPAALPVAKAVAPEPEPLPAPTPVDPSVESSPLERLQAVARFGLAMAKADGRIAAVERRQVRAFVERRYARSLELAGQLDPILRKAEEDLFSIAEAARLVRQVIPAEAWPELYQFAVSIADAAGERNTREIECLARIAEELGIGTKRVEVPGPAPISPPVKPDAAFTEHDSRAVLGIAAETTLSVELIRRQYHLLSDRFAAEKFSSHGPEFIQMAVEKRERIERAARHLLAEYNEPLEPPQPPPPSDLRHNPDLDDVFGA